MMRDSLAMAPVCFCFSVPDLLADSQVPYNQPAQRVVAQAALSSLVETVEMRAGDMLLPFMAMRMVAVGSSSIRTERARPGVAQTSRVDGQLLMTLLWDFCDAVGEQHTSLDFDRLPRLLGRGEVVGVALSDLDEAGYTAVDEAARDDRSYLGGFRPDMGNPVQARLVAALSHQGFIKDGELLLDPYDSGDPFDPPMPDPTDGWWTSTGLTTVRYSTEDERGTFPMWPSAPPSERGMQTAAVLAARSSETHLDRLGDAIVKGAEIGSAPFEVRREAMPGAADAVVEEPKLRGYVLNAEHPRGGHKAKLFRQLLGFEADQWELLAAQLKHGVAEATELVRVRTNEHGVAYHVIVDVTGPNGNTRPVLAAWEVRTGQAPRLVSAYIADRGAVSSGSGADAPALGPGLEGDDRWQALWDLASQAGDEASADCVPTPMLVSGEWVPSGQFGTAKVRIKLTASGFGPWLVGQGHARRDAGAADVGAGGILFDPALAHAEAFAGVLRLNGVPCEVIELLD